MSEGCSANIDNGADGSVRLLLLESCSETIGAGIAVQAEWSRLVDNTVPNGKDKYRWAASSASRARTAASIGGVKLKVGPFLSKDVIGRTRLAMLGKNLR